MMHNEDIVEEVKTKRQGKIDSIGATIVGGQQTPNQWRVYFSHGKDPLIKHFSNENDLRLISCLHEAARSGVYPARPIMDPEF